MLAEETPGATAHEEDPEEGKTAVAEAVEAETVEAETVEEPAVEAQAAPLAATVPPETGSGFEENGSDDTASHDMNDDMGFSGAREESAAGDFPAAHASGEDSSR